MLKKLFWPALTVDGDNVEKGIEDEIIFKTTKIRNREMLKLMVRSSMLVGEEGGVAQIAAKRYSENQVGDQQHHNRQRMRIYLCSRRS